MAALAIPIGNTTLAERGGTCRARREEKFKGRIMEGIYRRARFEATLHTKWMACHDVIMPSGWLTY
jgi:hypothetical protein